MISCRIRCGSTPTGCGFEDSRIQKTIHWFSRVCCELLNVPFFSGMTSLTWTHCSPWKGTFLFTRFHETAGRQWFTDFRARLQNALCLYRGTKIVERHLKTRQIRKPLVLKHQTPCSRWALNQKKTSMKADRQHRNDKKFLANKPDRIFPYVKKWLRSQI